jgi:hypothetical protein
MEIICCKSGSHVDCDLCAHSIPHRLESANDLSFGRNCRSWGECYTNPPTQDKKGNERAIKVRCTKQTTRNIYCEHNVFFAGPCKYCDVLEK